jgi:hypothetical protein
MVRPCSRRPARSGPRGRCRSARIRSTVRAGLGSGWKPNTRWSTQCRWPGGGHQGQARGRQRQARPSLGHAP